MAQPSLARPPLPRNSAECGAANQRDEPQRCIFLAWFEIRTPVAALGEGTSPRGRRPMDNTATRRVDTQIALWGASEAFGLLREVAVASGVSAAVWLPVVLDGQTLVVHRVAAAGPVCRRSLAALRGRCLGRVVDLALLPGVSPAPLAPELREVLGLADGLRAFGVAVCDGPVLLGFLVAWGSTLKRDLLRRVEATAIRRPPEISRHACAVWSGEEVRCSEGGRSWVGQRGQSLLPGPTATLIPGGITTSRTLGSGVTVVLYRPTPAAALAFFFTLSPAQRHIALLLAVGARVAEVAGAVARSAEAVRSQRAAIYRKLGLGSRAALTHALGPLLDVQ